MFAGVGDAFAAFIVVGIYLYQDMFRFPFCVKEGGLSSDSTSLEDILTRDFLDGECPEAVKSFHRRWTLAVA